MLTKSTAEVLTSFHMSFRYVKPCVPIISHRRPPESIEELGENTLAQWRPDSSMICVVVSTLKSYVLFHHHTLSFSEDSRIYNEGLPIVR